MVFRRLLNTPIKYPFLFGMGFSCLKTSSSDLMVQKLIEKREKIDWRRNAVFASFGLLYLGGIQYCLYVPIFGKMFSEAASFVAKPFMAKLRDRVGQSHVLGQVVLDQFVHHPLVYFPAFYLTREMVLSDDPEPMKALGEYSKNMGEDLVALWKIWVPATIINFAFMPMWGRIPFVACVSFGWTCLLSYKRGSDNAIPVSGMATFGVDALSMRMMTDEVFEAPALDPHRQHFLVTVFGPDGLGIVAALAANIWRHDGNISVSRMMKLGDDFVLMLVMDSQNERADQLCKALTDMGSDQILNGSQLKLRKISALTAPTIATEVVGGGGQQFSAKFKIMASDQPGTLFRVSSLLSKLGLSIHSMDTESVVDSLTGRRVFWLRLHVCGDHAPAPELLESQMEALRHDLGATLKWKVTRDVKDGVIDP